MERSTIFNGKTSTISMAMASIAFCMFTRPGSLKTCLQVQWIRTSNFPGFPALGIAPIDIYIYILRKVCLVIFPRAANCYSLPIGSMYAIYGNIYHQYTPNVSIYASTMDPMGW